VFSLTFERSFLLWFYACDSITSFLRLIKWLFILFKFSFAGFVRLWVLFLLLLLFLSIKDGLAEVLAKVSTLSFFFFTDWELPSLLLCLFVSSLFCHLVKYDRCYLWLINIEKYIDHICSLQKIFGQESNGFIIRQEIGKRFKWVTKNTLREKPKHNLK